MIVNPTSIKNLIKFSPDDVQAVAADILRHRLILSFEAEANGITPDRVIEELLAIVPVG